MAARRRNTFLAIIILLVLIIFTVQRHHNSRDHYLDPHGPSLQGVLYPEDWKHACRQHNFSPFPHQRKVYDLVLFSTELDWLEIRLHAHSPFVDYFVIIESPTTFTRKPKPLILQQNWDRFKDFHHKIIYRTVEDPIQSERHWDHEDFFRNALLYEVFPHLTGPRTAEKNDVLIVSDMDELLKPSALLLLRHCDFPKRLTLRTDFYYYSFQWLHRGEQWAHPQATTFSSSISNTLAPNDLRMNLISSPFGALSRWWDQATLWNSGWHCSSCFSTIAEMQTKMNSFSHQGWNTADNRDAKTMMERVRSGSDLFGRPGEIYDKIEGNTDVPEYILEKPGEFRYLLDRDGEDAGFADYKATTAAGN